VFADLSKLPPLLLLAGEDELLLDDARRIADAARLAGTQARLLVGKGMQHDWPLTLPWLGESPARGPRCGNSSQAGVTKNCSPARRHNYEAIPADRETTATRARA
jgi:acetyl esterase/lipase